MKPSLRHNFTLKLRHSKLKLGRHTRMMGVLNITPDSFSKDGLYKYSLASITKIAQGMINDGAKIIDVGGESSRPNAGPLSKKEELKRIIPVIKILAKNINVPISIDTYKPEVAEEALDNGASIVNDITGLRNFKMIEIIKKYKAAVIVMHMKGEPLNMQNNPRYRSLIATIKSSLKRSIKVAVDYGIKSDKIIIDPGIGFGKTSEHNFEIINRLREFTSLRFPILIGPSRKSFIGKVLNKPADKRVFGTAAAAAIGIANGAHIIRVHDTKAMSDVLKTADAIINNGRYET